MKFKVGDIVTCIMHTPYDAELLNKKFIIVEISRYSTYWVKFCNRQLFSETIENNNMGAIRNGRKEGFLGESSLELAEKAIKIINPYPVAIFLNSLK